MIFESSFMALQGVSYVISYKNDITEQIISLKYFSLPI